MPTSTNDTLTQRQAAVLQYIHEYWDEYRHSPSMQDIANYFGYKSRNSVACFLNTLERKGYVERRRGVSRSIIFKN